MPPSIPSNGGANDASTGNAMSRLPPLRKTSRNHTNLALESSSGSGIKQSHFRPPERRKSVKRSSVNDILRKSRNEMIIHENKSKSGRASSPPPARRNITELGNNSGNSENSDSSLDRVPSLTTSALDTTGLTPFGGISTVSPYGFYGGAASMMPPSPYLGMGMNTIGQPYLSGLNQMVYNIQNVIFSINQAIHMFGANQEALRHAWDSLNKMIENAVVTFHEMRALEIMERERETAEEREKRKRLKALRYAFVFGGSWLAYKLIRNLFFRKRGIQQRQRAPAMFGNNHYGQSNLDNMGVPSYGANPMSNFSAPNNFYGASNLGHSGYSGFGNGYF